MEQKVNENILVLKGNNNKKDFRKKALKNIMVLSLLIMAILLSTIIINNSYAAYPTKASNVSGSSTAKGTLSDNAGGGENFSISEVFDAVGEFLNKGSEPSGGIDPGEIGVSFAEQIKPIGNVLITIGLIVSVGGAVYLGIQFAIAGASADSKKQAEVKESLIAFGVAVIIFALAYPIWSMVVKFLSKLQQTMGG